MNQSNLPGDYVPLFSPPNIQMQSLLEPQLILQPCEMIASIPPTIKRVYFDKKSNVCILPKSKPDTNKCIMDREKEYRSKSRLNRQLHDEHRVFFANLKKKRQMKFQTESFAALVIQRYVRGFLSGKRFDQERYGKLNDLLRKSKKEEIFAVASSCDSCQEESTNILEGSESLTDAIPAEL